MIFMFLCIRQGIHAANLPYRMVPNKLTKPILALFWTTVPVMSASRWRDPAMSRRAASRPIAWSSIRWNGS